MHLIVPIQLDALFLARGTTCIGQDINFDQLPYIDSATGTDINGDRPFVSEAIIATPFQNDNLNLKPGMHLHWALPSMLTTTEYGGESTEFPAVPNRWYVLKQQQGQTDVEWVVESDYIWPDEKGCPIPELCRTLLPTDIKSGDKPFAYMGRKYLLEEWKKAPQPKENYWKHHWKKNLSAIGWGSPVFDTFYPNCRSVFGLHDKDILNIDPDEKLTYTVIGWYHDPDSTSNDDYVFKVLNLCKKHIEAEVEALPEQNRMTSEQKKQEIFQRTKDRFCDALHLVLPEDSTLPEQGMICYGKMEIIKTAPLPDNRNSIGVVVANTPTEAVSALLAHKVGNETGLSARMKKEEQLEAILLENQLKQLKLDIGSRLRELRHEKGFVSVDGGVRWMVQLTTAEKKESDNDSILPNDIKKKLDELNKVQWRYNLLGHDYESQLLALYADWSRYIFCCYPPQGETNQYPSQDRAMQFIKNNTLASVKYIKQQLGNYPLKNLSDSKRPTPPRHSLEAEIATKYKELLGLLEIKNKELAILEIKNEELPTDSVKKQKAQTAKWELLQTPGTNYWATSPPAVLLAEVKTDDNTFSPLSSSKRFGQANRRAGDNGLACFVKNLDISTEQGKKFNLSDILNQVEKINQNAAENEKFGLNTAGANVWHSFRVEWEVELFPIASGNAATKKDSNYAADFITQNFELAEGDADLTSGGVVRSGNAIFKDANIYQGSAFISPNAYKEYLQKFTEYNTRLVAQEENNTTENSIKTLVKDALQFLEAQELMAFSLGGFNEALLQQTQMATLAPADPLGFEDYQKFTEEISNLLNTGLGITVNPLATFTPIRNGALKILKLRLIDSFGRTSDIQPSNIITSSYCTVNNHSDWINLPPRLAQSATMSLRWKDSRPDEKKNTTENKPLESSPVCGWIVPNILDQNLMFFDAKGKHVGNLNPRGEWERDVFTPNTDNGDKINHPMMRQIVNWLMEKRQKDDNFMSSFIKCTADTMDNIYPEGKDSESILSVLTGRPMAIVQASINLFLKGKPAFDIDWTEFTQDFQRGGRENNKFTQVQFPYSIGDYRQINDNLIGYWKQNETEEIGDTFWLNDSSTAIPNFSNQSVLPESIIDEKQMRLIDQEMTFWDFTRKMIRNGALSKKHFIDAYFTNGSKIWDALVTAGWLKIVNPNQAIVYSNQDNLYCSIDDKPQSFTMLVNPTGVVHLRSGILPVKELALPEKFYKTALQNIEITFFTAPIIKPRSGLLLSLPVERGYTWSWLQAQKTSDGAYSFRRTLHKPNVRKAAFFSAFSKIKQSNDLETADMLWQKALEKKWITLINYFQDIENPTDDNLFAEVDNQAIEDESKKKEDEQDPLLSPFLTVLAQTLEGIRPYSDRAQFYGKMEIAEGWLSLKTISDT